jgi:4-amino-4-deoxy-L-arabinose transferase-like glycosyltransferase
MVTAEQKSGGVSSAPFMTTTTMTGRARHLPLTAVLLVAAVLRTWRLGQNGFDNEYYAAAVRSMSGGWRNFLYNAFDPAGFVSVDKPPVALWIQVASVKVFGFHWWSVLLPQVLEGLASVALVYDLRPESALAKP